MHLFYTSEFANEYLGIRRGQAPFPRGYPLADHRRATRGTGWGGGEAPAPASPSLPDQRGRRKDPGRR